jgi:hypothetical protein
VRTDRVRTAKKQVCKKWTLTETLQISLFLPKTSLLSKIISLLIFVGNLPRSGCGTGVFRSEIASKSVEITKFPVNFPVSRELQVETGSYLTAPTTIQSFQTADFRVDSKEAVSVGFSPVSFRSFGLW